MNVITNNQELSTAFDDAETIKQLQQLGQLHPTLVRASAGTGKTYQLTARLLRILFQGAAPESVLATTFTRKAASEILQRVLLTLAQAADPENDDALERLRDQVKLPSLPRSACLKLLSRLMQNIHRLRVCTLDSLFSQLARSFPFELNLPPAWRLLDDIEETWTREQALAWSKRRSRHYYRCSARAKSNARLLAKC